MKMQPLIWILKFKILKLREKYLLFYITFSKNNPISFKTFKFEVSSFELVQAYFGYCFGNYVYKFLFIFLNQRTFFMPIPKMQFVFGLRM